MPYRAFDITPKIEVPKALTAFSDAFPRATIDPANSAFDSPELNRLQLAGKIMEPPPSYAQGMAVP